ncbi:MAG: hypothetical protein OXC93_01240 [Rhodospirillaceae bacterium]|nr:hypothetical protein [Rhodospirillaceae bacterium]
MNSENNPKLQSKGVFYKASLARPHQPAKEDMDKDVSVPVTPEHLAQAVVKCGTKRRKY